MAVVYDILQSDVSWYSDPLPGTAKDNFDRIIQLRKAFCHPLTINKDGTLNAKYFSNESKETAMNWSDIQMLQLLEGIYLHGVDSPERWHAIQSQFLPQRDFIEVRLKLTQMLGTQDLDQYANTKFSSEKQISDEFAKNKAEAMKNGCWDEKSDVALKPEVAKLSRADVKRLQKEELANWEKVIYNNPSYIYRTKCDKNSKSSSKASSKASSKKSSKPTSPKGKGGKKKKAAKKEQSNTLENYTKPKKKEEVAAVQKKVEEAEVEEVEEEEVVMEEPEPKVAEKPKKQSKAKSKKAKKSNKKKKGVPALPESSDDEDMLCVE